MKKKLALVGSGISAMACAHYLRDDLEISVFDKNDYLGGHTHTHILEEGGRKFTIDTGFIVFNQETYGNLLRFFAELGVEKQESDMSFSVYNQQTGLQYSGSSLLHLFSQKKNLFSPRYWKFLNEINRFFAAALRDQSGIQGSTETVAEYCRRQGLSAYFLENYLAPMSSAVWSAPTASAADFPISLLLPFFYNHGLLGLNRQFQWYTVKGGSDAYIKEIVRQGSLDIHLNEAVLSARDAGDKVILKTERREYAFDYAVLASHADESLKIAGELAGERRRILAAFSYYPNQAVLHTDAAVMPTIKKAWAAWNHVISRDGGRSSTVYWVNKLQRPAAKTDYFVSINPFQSIDPAKIVITLYYSHPAFTVENQALQKRLKELNQGTRLLFAGAYFGYGFHEDGLKAGLAAVEILKSKI